MTIAVGSDHAGLELKTLVIEHLGEMGYDTEDFGTHSETRTPPARLPVP